MFSTFRIWNIETPGVDACPAAATRGLIASYVFGATGSSLADLSGNQYDGSIHDAAWSNELPVAQQCQRQASQVFSSGD
jgi:hypothetical protein